MKLFPILALVGACALAGCAADTTDNQDQTDDQGEADENVDQTSEDLTAQRKHHYKAIDPSIFWKPGCGIRLPDGHICEMGLFLTFTRQYIDLQVTRHTTVDNGNKVITVHLDTWSKNTVHPMVAVHPQTERIDDAHATSMGPYKTRVVDYRGRVLFTGTVNMMPAP